jgi:hypothetical protein
MGGSSKPKQVVTPAPMPSVRPAPTMRAPAQPNIFGQSSAAYKSALSAARGAASYQPEQVGTTFGYTPDTIEAQTAAGGIQTYMNPYEQQVIDLSMADLERQRQMQMAQMGAQATAARAFGGSRQGIAQALTNEGFAQQGGQLAAQLRHQGFQTALGASQQDVANQIQAALANQAARAAQEQFAQGTRLQAQQANQSAGLQGAGLRLNAAGTLGNLSQTGFNMGQAITQQQAQQGATQRGINQALIDAGRAQYGGFTGAPAQSLNTRLGVLGATNMGQQTSTTTQKPGLFNYLSLGLGAL